MAAFSRQWLNGTALDVSTSFTLKGESVMEFTEEVLERIAGQLASLQLKFAIVRSLLIQRGASEAGLDQLLNQSLAGPEFEQARTAILEYLHGQGH
jgi:hypothetical protein